MIRKSPTKNVIQGCLLLALCTILPTHSQSAEKDTKRLDNASGASEQSSQYNSHNPSSAIPDSHPKGSIPALKALAKENPGAAYDLGLRFFRGDGVSQDSYKALQWMRNAAEHGDLEAQKAVGKFYLTGLEEMGADPQEAEKWLTMAAQRGDKEAEELLLEATKAKTKQQAEYSRWRNDWRQRSYQSWRYGYPYRGYWHDGGWYYR